MQFLGFATMRLSRLEDLPNFPAVKDIECIAVDTFPRKNPAMQIWGAFLRKVLPLLLMRVLGLKPEKMKAVTAPYYKP